MDTHPPDFKVIIVHEDSVTGLKATAVLKRLATLLGIRFGIDISPWQFCDHAWQFKWLQDPELSVQAMADAETVDMIIISAGAHTELPACVRAWIENVLARKQAGAMALVALLDGRRTAPDTSLNSAPYLRRLAGQNGVDFYCNLDHGPSPEEFDIESIFYRSGGGLDFSGKPSTDNSGRRRWWIDKSQQTTN